MPEDELAPVDLSWFYNLHPDVQVALLGNPHAALTGDLAAHLAKSGPGVYQAYWVSNGAPGPWALVGDAAETLWAIRLQLDDWWSNLSEDGQRYITENRSGELDGAYYDIIHRASRDPVDDRPNAHLVVMVSDNKTGRFRLPEMIRIYVEMQVAS